MSKQNHIAFVVGARPNFVKIAPILRALEEYPEIHATLIHTGQHYDSALSDVFFEELNVRKPDIFLGVGSGKHGAQTAKILERVEEVLEKGPAPAERFDRLVVVGDVNSTMAATLAAAKLGIPVAHVEAGLRSFDRTMPEEINRLVTDAIADLHLVSEPAGMENLRREGHPESRLRLVGNTMIDTLRHYLPAAKARRVPERMELTPGEYGVVTLHRPSNVDDVDTLLPLVRMLLKISQELPLIFPIHPRTMAKLSSYGLVDELRAAKGLQSLEPQGYLDFLALTSQAKFMITDSGGLQEESTALEIPCLTMRPNTERPITVELGSSTLIGTDMQMLEQCYRDVQTGRYKVGHCPELWDGQASQRIAKILSESAT